MKDRTSVYHVMSRTARGEFWLEAEEREMLRKMMRKQAAFAGVEILAYCMMGNHFHLLIRVPECPLKRDGKHLIEDGEILRRYAAFYGTVRPRSTYSIGELRQALEAGGAVAELARRTVLARMGDLSAFMKELKQRFGIWFNDRHKNHGTIWQDRFKSVVVENTAEVLSKVAAYIDLNPVRAGLVDNPRDYRWCGFGAAMRGSDVSKEGIRAIYDDCRGVETYLDALRMYRMLIYARGGAGKSLFAKDNGRIDPDAVRSVMENGGKVTIAEALHCRLSDFSESIALGGAAFLRQCQILWARDGMRPGPWLGWKRFQEFTEDDAEGREAE